MPVLLEESSLQRAEPTPEIEVPAVTRIDASLLTDRIKVLIAGAMAGTLPMPPGSDPGLPKKLNPVHINMVLDRAAGLRNNEIAEKYGTTQTWTSILLRHPYAEQLCNALLSLSADKLTDPRQRIEAASHEMLDIKLEIARAPGTSAVLRDRIASDILDRAGYGARKSLSVDVAHAISLPAAAAANLSNALLESNRVTEVDYTRYLAKSQPIEKAEVTKITTTPAKIHPALPGHHGSQVAGPPDVPAKGIPAQAEAETEDSETFGPRFSEDSEAAA